MSAILTDQFRILRASEFISSVEDINNSYYAFLSVPNTDEIDSNWETNIPDPIDSFDEENRAFDNIVALSKITPSDVRQVVKKYEWISGETYEMYRNDYSRVNRSPATNSTRLYDSKFYVLTSQFRVYICLQNGTDASNPQGRPSVNEPTHTTSTPQSAGDGSDKYIWKYLYTISPNDAIKFDSTNFIPVPQSWSTNPEVSLIRDTSVDGSIEVAVITNSGIGYGSANTINNIPIIGDGSGAEASITISSEGKVVDVIITNSGSGYSYGTLDISNITHTGIGSTTIANFDVVIPPKGGHGKDIYRELGCNKVLLYSRFENLQFQNPDVISSNSFSRLGVLKNPLKFDGTSQFSESTASGLYALKLTGIGSSSLSFTDDERIIQTISAGSTSVGRVASYDKSTQILKFWQDRSLVLTQPKGGPSSPAYGNEPEYGYELHRFTGSIGSGGSLVIGQPDNSSPNGLEIDNSFNGSTTTINNRTYNLGQEFVNGVANPEIKPRSGDIIYVDNRESIPRSRNQKEDIKIIIEF
jgi:hypothetical protein